MEARKLENEICSATELRSVPENRSAWANSDHTKRVVAATNAISESKRCTGIEADYRRFVSRQLSSIGNLSDQH
jgi:hypothetical protein